MRKHSVFPPSNMAYTPTEYIENFLIPSLEQPKRNIDSYKIFKDGHHTIDPKSKYILDGIYYVDLEHNLAFLEIPQQAMSPSVKISCTANVNDAELKAEVCRSSIGKFLTIESSTMDRLWYVFTVVVNG